MRLLAHKDFLIAVRMAVAIVISVFLLDQLVTSANAQSRSRGLPLVRDAEIEGLLKDYTQPIFNAAGLSSRSIEVFLLNRNDFNAFVTGTRMFINTGAIMQSATPNEIIGVIAHETGHIIGGHLTGLRDRIEKSRILSVLGLLAGAGAAATGTSDGARAGGAIALGSQSALSRNLLKYQREDEIAADRDGIRLLEKTGQSGRGMLATFKRLGQNRLFTSGGLDPYAQSHPLPRERIALLQDVVASSRHVKARDPANLQLRHDFARAKIAAYAGGASLVRNIFGKNINSDPAVYGIAISHFRQGSAKRGLPLIERLVKKYPRTAYFHEMKGEMLLKSGRASEAATAFRKAVAVDKRQAGHLRVQLGHALIETGKSENIPEAQNVLKAGVARDPYSVRGYRYLARAYAANGQRDLAMAATAEERFLAGDLKAAKQFAARAQPRLKTGTPQWRRLQDILEFTR